LVVVVCAVRVSATFLAVTRSNRAMENYDPEKTPAAEEWPETDEGERI